MKYLAVIFFCAALALSASAGHLGATIVGPGTHGVALQGPSAKASLIGPDGSHISAVAPGGAVLAAPRHGGVVSAAVAPGHVAVGHGIGHLAVAAPIAYVAPALIGVGHGGGLHPLAPGSGLEGQWIPDHSEKLYDDGQYRGEVIGYGGLGVLGHHY